MEEEAADNPADFDRLTVRQMKAFLSRRLFSRNNYDREQLRRLCIEVEKLVPIAPPSESEIQRQAEERLKEALSVVPGPIISLPKPDEGEINWSLSYADLPEMTLLGMYDYFVLSPSPVFPAEKLHAYKALSAYQSVVSGSVDDVQSSTNLPGGWIYVKGTVKASQRIQWYQCWCLMNKETGQIRMCRCKCPAGLGEACSHVASLMFFIVMATEQGVNKPPTATDVACRWLPPSTKKTVEPKRVIDLLAMEGRRYKRPRLDHVSIPSVEEHEAIVHSSHPNSCFGFALRRPGPPAPDVNGRSQESCLPTSIEPEYEEDSSQLDLAAHKIRNVVSAAVESDGVDRVDPKAVFAAVAASITEESSKAILEGTIHQASDKEWTSLRWGRVTASVAHSVRTFMGPRGNFWKQKAPVSAVRSICPSDGYTLDHLPSMQYGRRNEDPAAALYLKFAEALGWHQNVRLEKVGLLIPAGSGHIGASVDRLIHCSCHAQPTILEIKCPKSIKKLEPTYKAVQSKLKYLSVDLHGDGSLKTSSAYYTQIQLQMAIWNLPRAELFIYSPRASQQPFTPIRIDFDACLWSALKVDIDLFYLRFVLPFVLSAQCAG